LPVIKGNLELPGKGNTRLLRRYINQGRILPNSFSGKVLVSHPVGYSILSSDVTAAVTSNYPGVKISFDKFGISKLIKIGVLCGTLKHDNRQALTAYWEAALSQQNNTGFVPIKSLGNLSLLMAKTPLQLKQSSLSAGLKMLPVLNGLSLVCMAPPQLTRTHYVPL
jgi:hypothetical protein